MDPNEVLFAARLSAARILACIEDCVPIDDEDSLILAEAFSNLDEWLCKKGFYPKELEK